MADARSTADRIGTGGFGFGFWRTSDQRLIHQLYLDKTALVLLVVQFGPRCRCCPDSRNGSSAATFIHPIHNVLVAAGQTLYGFNRRSNASFRQSEWLQVFETSAQSGAGCETLRKAIKPTLTGRSRASHISGHFKLTKGRSSLNSAIRVMLCGPSRNCARCWRQRIPAAVRFTD